MQNHWIMMLAFFPILASPTSAQVVNLEPGTYIRLEVSGSEPVAGVLKDWTSEAVTLVDGKVTHSIRTSTVEWVETGQDSGSHIWRGAIIGGLAGLGVAALADATTSDESYTRCPQSDGDTWFVLCSNTSGSDGGTLAAVSVLLGFTLGAVIGSHSKTYEFSGKQSFDVRPTAHLSARGRSTLGLRIRF